MNNSDNDQISKDVPQNVVDFVQNEADANGHNVLSIDPYTEDNKQKVYKAVFQDPTTGDTGYMDVAVKKN